jgi:preprotein translocase subunit SecE
MNDKMTRVDLILWTSVVVFTVLFAVLSYVFHNLGPMQTLVGMVWMFFSVVLLSMTKQGKQLVLFINESKRELQKVVWPTRQETIQTTVIVIVTVMLAAFFLWGVDALIMWAVGKITHLG